MITPTIGGSRVEVGTSHDGLCDPLTMDIVRASCGVGDSGSAY